MNYDDGNDEDGMTLYDLHAALEGLPLDLVFPNGFENPHSWRGDYRELSFEPANNVTVREMLASIDRAVSEVFIGWKGGDYSYTMGNSPYFACEGNADTQQFTASMWQGMVDAARR